jgi:hypothetical protein
MDFANPVFTWEPVPEAAAYVVELCADPGCGALVDRIVFAKADGEPEWRPAALPARILYWRATARSRSGLDGYPAETARLDILSDRLDHEGPAAKLALSGRQIDVAGRLFTAAVIGLAITAEDGGCGLLRTTPTVDGRPAATGPLPAGEHRAGGYALDRCGNRLEVPPLVFTVDAEPPAVRSAVVLRSVFESAGEPQAIRHSGRRAGETGLYWSSDGRRWLPLWRPGQAPSPALSPEVGGNEIASGQPRLFLEARGVKLTIDGQTVAPGPGELLAVTAEDTGAGVERLRFHLTGGGPEGAPVLEMEAVDLVGNSRRIAWPLVLPAQ